MAAALVSVRLRGVVRPEIVWKPLWVATALGSICTAEDALRGGMIDDASVGGVALRLAIEVPGNTVETIRCGFYRCAQRLRC